MLKNSVVPFLVLCSILSGCSESEIGGENIFEDDEKITEGNGSVGGDKKVVPNLTPTGVKKYNDQWLVAMDNESLATSTQDRTVTNTGEVLKQSFKLRSSNPIEETVYLSHLFFKQYFWTGADSEITFSIIDADSQELLVQQNFNTSSISTRSGIVLPEAGANPIVFDQPLAIELNKSYVMQFHVNNAEFSLSLYRSTQDYLDGESNDGGDIWFKAIASAKWLQYDAIDISSDDNNQLVYDSGLATPLKSKMLSVDGSSELLVIDKRLAELALTYELSDPDMASLQVDADVVANQDQLYLQGLQQGSSSLNIYHNQQLIERIELQITKNRSIDLSYSYIAYPGEVEHEKMDMFNRVKSDFESVYKPLNIKINWHNNDVLEFEWDLNGDGYSWTENSDEMLSPITQNIIPNAERYFSNLYLVRVNKDDEFFGGCNGGGSSLTSSEMRVGYKSVHTKGDLGCVPPTLMHELGHNLGLAHYSDANTDNLPIENQYLNMMKTGRDENQVFAFQWKIIHKTLKDLSDLGRI